MDIPLSMNYHNLKVISNLSYKVMLNVISSNLMYNFIVAEKLVASAILDVDFLHVNPLILDFHTNPVSI